MRIMKTVPKCEDVHVLKYTFWCGRNLSIVQTHEIASIKSRIESDLCLKKLMYPIPFQGGTKERVDYS